MKKRKIVMSILIVTMLVSCMACGKIHNHKVDDLKPLADAGVITGVKDITVAEGTDVNLNDLVYADKSVVKSVDIDDSAVDYSKAGTYEVIYTITFDGDKLRDYVKDNNLKLDFDTDGDTIVVKTTVTVTVATKEDADKAIANGATDVVTTETKESVAESNKAKANDNAVTSKPAEKPAGNTGNSNAGKNNSNSGNANTGNSNSGNSNTGNNNGGNNSSTEKPTEKPHVHSYNGGVVTKEADCTHTGIKTYTCVNGDHSYTETIPALGHNPVQRTETVTVKEAYDEDVWEPRYICNGCGASFKTELEVGRHLISANRKNPDTPCGNYYSDSVKVNTITHPAETENRTYTVCSRCGERLK